MEGMFDRILAVGAHVDDVELFAGGTLAKHADNAAVLVFSHHHGIATSPESEFQNSMNIIGVKHFHAWDLNACDGSFQNKRSFIYNELVRYRNDFKPTVVVTHQSTDSNQDHRQIFDEVWRVFKNRVSVICGWFPCNAPTLETKMWVKIDSEHFSRKIMALDCYKSQQINSRYYFDVKWWHNFLQFHGTMVGCKYAEPFEIVQVIV